MIANFDEWWHWAYFRTDHAYYQIYKKLYEAGADIEYIDGLTRILRITDEDSLSLQDEFKATAGKNHPTHPMGRRKWVKRQIREYTRKKRLSLTAAEQRELEKEMEARVATQTKERLEKTKNSYLQNANKVSETNPVQSLVFEYGGNPFYYGTGRRPDDIGSFFLLAVSEHLRERSGKPQFLLAANLLRTVRGQKPDWSKRFRLQAMVRVDKFKKSGRDWKKHLKICQDSYREFKSGGSPSPIATEQVLTVLEQGGDIKTTFER